MSKREIGVLVALTIGVSLLATRSTVYVLLSIGGAGLLYLLFVRRSARVWLAAASAAAGGAAFEFVGRRILEGRLGAMHAVDVDHRMKPDPTRGINDDGIRSARAASAFGAEGFNVVFLGDSFTFGSGVAADEAYPARVEARLRERGVAPEPRAANFGWVSSSPLLSLRLLRDIGAKYRPSLVVLGLDMSDFHDDLQYKLLLQDRGQCTVSPTTFLLRSVGLLPQWNAVRDGLRFGRPDSRLPRERYFVACQPLRRSQPFLEETENNLREIDRECRERLHAPFVVFGLPRGFQYSRRESTESWERREYEPLGPWVEEPFLWLEQLRERAPFPVRSLLEAFKKTDVFPTCFGNDPHWNAQGHQVAADAIVESLRDLGARGAIALRVP